MEWEVALGRSGIENWDLTVPLYFIMPGQGISGNKITDTQWFLQISQIYSIIPLCLSV